MSISSEDVVLTETIANAEPSSILTSACDIESQFDGIQQNLIKFKATVSDMQQQLRTLEKAIKKENKKNETAVLKPLMKQPKIVGFDIPEKITPELCVFMKLPVESNSTRNAVTAFITEYIRAQKLQDMTDRKSIQLNDELAALFKLDITSHLTYFNLHKHIRTLFIKK
jgi:hypothetical protein